jgi:hypothetical protein
VALVVKRQEFVCLALEFGDKNHVAEGRVQGVGASYGDAASDKVGDSSMATQCGIPYRRYSVQKVDLYLLICGWAMCGRNGI